jgi:hypothetical protein
VLKYINLSISQFSFYISFFKRKNESGYGTAALAFLDLTHNSAVPGDKVAGA